MMATAGDNEFIRCADVTHTREKYHAENRQTEIADPLQECSHQHAPTACVTACTMTQRSRGNLMLDH